MESRAEVNKGSIRSTMNLMYSMMRFLSVLLDLAQENPLACETLAVTADGLFQLGAELYRDINLYSEMVSETEERVSASG